MVKSLQQRNPLLLLYNIVSGVELTIWYADVIIPLIPKTIYTNKPIFSRTLWKTLGRHVKIILMDNFIEYL